VITPDPVTLDEAREFCRAVLRVFPGREDTLGGGR